MLVSKMCAQCEREWDSDLSAARSMYTAQRLRARDLPEPSEPEAKRSARDSRGRESERLASRRRLREGRSSETILWETRGEGARDTPTISFGRREASVDSRRESGVRLRPVSALSSEKS